MADLGCRQAELLEADAEMGRAGEVERMRLELHLQGCESCAARGERLRSLSSVLREEPVETRVPNRALVASAIMEASGEREEGTGRPIAAWLAAAAVLLAVGGTAFWVWSGGAPSREVPVAERDSEESAPTEGHETTPESGEPEAAPAALTAAETPCAGVRTESTSATRAYLLSSGDRCRLRLDHGELRVFVDPEEGADLAIATPSAQVRVVGTVFSVGVEDGFTSVVVYRGTVEVSQEEESVRVTGGHRVDVRRDRPETTVRAADADALEPLERMTREPAPAAAGHPAGGRPIPDTPGSAAAETPAAEGEERPAGGSEPPAGGEPATGETGADETTEAAVANLRRLLREGRPAQARAQASQRADRPEYARRRGELLTVIAESYAMERRWRDAFDWYGRASEAAPGTATAANALVAAANIALDRLRNPAEAAELYLTYLQRFPRGALREDAFIGRCRALRAAGRRDAAASCARVYLATHPDGRFRDRAERLIE